MIRELGVLLTLFLALGMVSAYDEPPDAPNGSLMNCTVKTQTGEMHGRVIDLHLQPGWNMVGYPYTAMSFYPATFVDALCNDVCGYCPVSPKLHIEWVNTGPTSGYYSVAPMSMFNTGYFLLNLGMSENDDWYCCIEGYDPVIYTLRRGWNIVTNPCCEEKTVLELFGNGTVSNNKGFWYNPSTSGYDPSTTMVPGRAYWVNSMTDKEVSIRCKIQPVTNARGGNSEAVTTVKGQTETVKEGTQNTDGKQ